MSSQSDPRRVSSELSNTWTDFNSAIKHAVWFELLCVWTFTWKTCEQYNNHTITLTADRVQPLKLPAKSSMLLLQRIPPNITYQHCMMSFWPRPSLFRVLMSINRNRHSEVFMNASPASHKHELQLRCASLPICLAARSRLFSSWLAACCWLLSWCLVQKWTIFCHVRPSLANSSCLFRRLA